MLAAAPYRCVDGRWAASLDQVALGFGKLSITPEELDEQQPVFSHASGCAVIADVRLDNRHQLLRDLSMGDRGRVTDAMIILRAYEMWGAGSLPRLLGDFALIIWDPRHTRLVAARDTSGQRTLYYRTTGNTIALASEIQQLLQDRGVPVEPNDERIREYLTPFNVARNDKDQAGTFYRGIHAVPAGHMMIAEPDRMSVRAYWQLQPPATIRYPDSDDYADHYRELFFDVVSARLRSSHPVGALLSAGLDSTSVVGVAQELRRSRPELDKGFVSFTTRFDGLDCDETPLVADLQAKYGFPAEYISADQLAGRFQLNPRGFQAGPNMGVPRVRDAMFTAIRRQGVRAVLTGDIADACVGGSWLIFDSLLRQGQISTFLRYLDEYRRKTDEPLHTVLTLYCLGPFLPMSIQRRLMHIYTARNLQRNAAHLLPRWIAPSVRDDLTARHRQLCLETERARRFANQTQEQEYRLLYPPEAVQHPAPWPIEIWRPFADRRLHAFMLAIPPDQKFTPNREVGEGMYPRSKQIVRRAMRGILPESIRLRADKTTFTSGAQSEIDRNWSSLQAAFGPGGQAETAARGYVDQTKFWSRLQEMRAGTLGADLVYVLRVAELETWLRTFRLPWRQLVTVPGPWSPSMELESALERR
jgi:asparagine synthase (glutamine-hydrolysing)